MSLSSAALPPNRIGMSRCCSPIPRAMAAKTLRVLTGTDDEDRGLETEIGRGTTGETSQLQLGPRGSVWVGLARLEAGWPSQPGPGRCGWPTW